MLERYNSPTSSKLFSNGLKNSNKMKVIFPLFYTRTHTEVDQKEKLFPDEKDKTLETNKIFYTFEKDKTLKTQKKYKK